MKERPPEIELPRERFTILFARRAGERCFNELAHQDYLSLEQTYGANFIIDWELGKIIKSMWNMAWRPATIDDLIFAIEMDGEPW